MKLKIFSVSALAFAGLMAYSTANYAQQAPAVAPAPPVAPNGKTYAEATVTLESGQGGYIQSTGDTTYDRKMRKLREQQRALQAQMEDLRRENNKRNSEAMRQRMDENARRMNERMAENSKRMSEKFTNTFKNFGNSFRFNYDNDSTLKKRVQTGEVKEKIKSYSKSYTVDGNDQIKIDNRYGKIIVTTWAKNEVKVDVQVKAYALNDADAQRWLDETSIADNKSGDQVSFKTNIDSKENNWGTSMSNGKIDYLHKEIINYTVYMPAKNALAIDNRYGGIDLPNMDGKVNINNSYGGLLAKALTNPGNSINIRYGNAEIGTLAASDVKIGYGNVKIENADKLNLQLSYSAGRIGKLSNSGTITLHYGDGLEIKDVEKNLRSLSITSSYAPVRLNAATVANSDFEVTVHNADFGYDSNAVSITNKTPEDGARGWSSTKTYKGHVGKGSADKMITITAHYGNVKFDQ